MRDGESVGDLNDFVSNDGDGPALQSDILERERKRESEKERTTLSDTRGAFRSRVRTSNFFYHRQEC